MAVRATFWGVRSDEPAVVLLTPVNETFGSTCEAWNLLTGLCSTFISAGAHHASRLKVDEMPKVIKGMGWMRMVPSSMSRR